VQEQALWPVPEQRPVQPPVPQLAQEPAQVESPGPEQLLAAKKRLHSYS
jgi:hypothetical protein